MKNYSSSQCDTVLYYLLLQNHVGSVGCSPAAGYPAQCSAGAWQDESNAKGTVHDAVVHQIGVLE